MLVDDIRVPTWKWLRQQGKPSANTVLNLFGIDSPPIDVESIIHRLGISLMNLPKEVTSVGLACIEGDHASVYVRTGENKSRRRFTLAHELGHIMLHGSGTHARDDMRFVDANFSPRSQPEVEANAFAADLLMPPVMVTRVWLASGRNLAETAWAFQVSDLAMGYRLSDLRLASKAEVIP